MEALKQAVLRYADGHADADGIVRTPVPGLRMMRVHAPTGPMRSVYRPLVCLILQGAKQLTVGGERRSVRAGQSAIIGVDVPVIGQIVEASRDAPYMAVAIELDMGVLHEVTLRTEVGTRARPPASARFFSGDLDDALLGCAMQLMYVLDHPAAGSVVRPAALQQLHCWLLASRHGPELRRLAQPTGHARRIAAAVELVRQEFRQPLRVERLAAAANMSPSAFRRHFRATTSLAPLQFQKQLRLIEARRLMLAEGWTATRVATEVGYASVPQFTREYRRMFGAPPRRDASAAAL
ncbi:AraC family transcriptional regulator [Luteimonas sp. RD2P54]|uniref:AraC family transcriptional regulator n=1 Tax=Luteimonas endophytica TaxID=3042023 RepID=A0ABT6JCY2_9GAMM|nr:AraC family transcriptional regulator [Luteimonas endophytica]MDH5824672.1 AraC family transcriptional regulator [Luteimonas endophytica]